MKKTLTLLLSENRLLLEADLGRAEDARQSVTEANKYIDQIQLEYCRHLTVHQLPVAASMLQVVRTTLSSLDATRGEVWENPAKQSSGVPRGAGRAEGLLAAKGGQLLLAAALIVTLISSHSWTAFILAALLVASEALVQLRARRPGTWFRKLLGLRKTETSTIADAREAGPERRSVVRVDPRKFGDCLEDVFAVIDVVVEQAIPDPPPAPQSREIEQQFPEVVDLFYELLGASSLKDDDGLRKLVGGRLLQVLRREGIDVICYPPPPERAAERLYELQETSDPDVRPHLVMYPALVRDTHVVREGRVLVPVV